MICAARWRDLKTDETKSCPGEATHFSVEPFLLPLCPRHTEILHCVERTPELDDLYSVQSTLHE